MKNWFTVKRWNSDTFVISEWRHWEETHCYLLLGKERALLIDTGLGVGDLRAQVEQLTDLPVLVVSTHVHWDHIGGHRQFTQHGVHPLEQDWLQGHFPLPLAVVKQQLMKDFTPPEGFRLQDLKRWGKLYNNGVSFERKPQTSSLAEGSSLKITYDNPLFVWPIPQHEIEAPGSEVLPNESNK